MPRLIIVLTLSLAFLSLSCGKSSSKNNGATVDFTKYDLIQFKAGSSIGVSATRYDLTIANKTLKKYNYSSTAGNYVLEKEMTMTEASKSDLSIKLKKVTVKTLGACGGTTCNGARASVWMELTNVSPAKYFFSNQGDCTCAQDGANAPTLIYTQMDAIYKQILALLGA